VPGEDFTMPASTEFEAFTDASTDPPIRGFIHHPAVVVRDGLVLTHGAGANSSSPLLINIASAFAEAGIVVLRCDLPFRQLRRFGPPRPGEAIRDREGLQRAASVLRQHVPGRVFLGGHSYGGRQASMLCAENPEWADGLLLLSYPLHPPRHPEQLRTQHLSNLHTPSMFVHGTRDPFGTMQELETALKLIPAKCLLIGAEGAGHDLTRGLRMEEIPARFTEFLAA
jgi:uncharacterized protein